MSNQELIVRHSYPTRVFNHYADSITMTTETLDIRALMTLTTFLGKIGIKSLRDIDAHQPVNDIRYSVYGFGYLKVKSILDRVYSYKRM